MLILCRVEARIPQTPKTPSASAAHYFDDVFSRQRGISGVTRSRRPFSRSSSICARNDRGVTNYRKEEGSLTRSSSIGYLNAEEIKQREEWDHHVAKYVSERMESLKSGAVEMMFGDELEA